MLYQSILISLEIRFLSGFAELWPPGAHSSYFAPLYLLFRGAWWERIEYYYYLRQGGYVFVIFCLSVCLLATLRKNFWMDLHEISREGWQWAIVSDIAIFVLKRDVKLQLTGNGPLNKWLNFGGDPSTDAGPNVTLARPALVEVCTVSVLVGITDIIITTVITTTTTTTTTFDTSLQFVSCSLWC